MESIKPVNLTGLVNGMKTRFKKGSPSWNKGTRGICKSNSGSFKKGNIPPFKGKKLPEYIKNAVKVANTGRKQTKEEIEKRIISNKITWDKKGRKKYKRYIHTTATKRYKQWRSDVFERDNWTCQTCGEKGYLEAHHIKSWALYPELRYVVENGVTLCKDCHKLTRKKND